MKSSPMRPTVLIGLVVLGGIVARIVGCGGSSDGEPTEPVVTARRTNPLLPKEYAVLAIHAAGDLELDPKLLTKQQSDVEALAELQRIQLDLQNLTSDNPQLNTLIDRAKADCAELSQLMDEVNRLPAGPGFFEGLVGGAISGYTGNPLPLAGVLSSATEADSAREAWLRRYGAVTDRLHATTLVLPHLAEKYAGPEVESGTAILMDYDDDWRQADGSDWITLGNNSAMTLHNVTVEVHLRGGTGETCRNVHFLAEWAPKTPVYGRYAPGFVINDRHYFREVVEHPEAIELAVYCDELTQKKIAYQYMGEERDTDIARYLESLQLRSRYRPYADGIIFDDQRSAFFSFEGLPQLQHGEIVVTLFNDDQEASVTVPFETWEAGQELRADFPDIDWEAIEYEMVLRFRDSNANKIYTWTRPQQDAASG